jgi:hypothetical protein
MKKYITFDSVAYPLALLTFVFIAVTLLTACLNLQNRVHQKNQMKQEVRAMFAQLEKPL